MNKTVKLFSYGMIGAFVVGLGLVLWNSADLLAGF